MVGQEWVRHRPHPALRGLVAEATGYRQDGLTPGVHRGLPSPALTLIVTLDDPLEMAAHPDPRQSPGRYAALVGGLHTGPALIATGTRQAGIQLSLTPAGARALLGVPAGALGSRDEHLGDVLGEPAAELVDRLRMTRTWPDRFAAVDDVLRRLAVRAAPGACPELAHAWRLTTGSGGRLPVATVARTVGWSERHLRQRFTAEFGLGPKEAARVVRFDAARRLLGSAVARGEETDLAGLAAVAGYADQAHLTREWREHTGLPPRRWLAAEHQQLRADADDLLRFVQDGRPAMPST